MERGVTSGGTDTVDDISTVGWMGAEQGNAQCLDKVILDGWDGDYPDGYGDDPSDGVESGYGDTGGNYGGKYSGA